MRKAKRDEKYPENGFEEWGGYMNAKKAKLTEQFNKGAAKESNVQATSKIFSGISVYVNGYTVPSSDEIKMAMMLNGGQFHQYYSASKTKFIVASNLAYAKLKKLKGHPKVVKPQWIADCVAAKKLLDFCPYLLYSNQSNVQPKIQFPQLSEFESPVPTPRMRELPISCQKMTSTPKPIKNLKEKPSQESSLDLSGQIFDEPSTSRAQLDNSNLAELISSDSRESASSSDVSLFGEGNLAESTKVIQNNIENDGDELDDMFDCTLVAEGLDEVERLAEQSKLSRSGDNELAADVTTDAARELLEETKVEENLSSCETTAGADQLQSSSSTADCLKVEKPVLRDAPMKRAGESNFLAEFYSNSRLHHISTMGSTFKAYITELRKSHTGHFSGLAKLKRWKDENFVDRTWSGGKIIMHIDMDCFFVSVGLRSRPELEGQPVAVTHAKGNPPAGSNAGASRETEFELYKQRMEKKAGVDQSSKNYEAALEKRLTWRSDGSDRSSMSEIASCNYEARKAGLKNGMFLGQALKLCPSLQTIPYDFEGYTEVSYALYNTVASFTLDVEAVSCDEMFVDCTQLLKETNCHPLDFATFIRKEIKEITQCKASAGFGSNVLRARMATKKAKPDGQFYLQTNEVLEFMKDIKISDLPGVGRNLTFKMQTLGLQTCADLQKLPLSRMQSNFGQKLGTSLYKHCRGDDERVLEFEHVRKSVSAEVNYGIRFKTHDECHHFIKELAQEVHARLEAIGKKGRCITLKLMVKTKEAPEETAKFMGHGVCNNVSKSANLPSETSDSAVIAREVMQMLAQLAIDFKLLRGIGVQMTKLTEKKKGESRLSQFVTKGIQKQVQAQKSEEPAASAPHIDQDVLAELPEDIRQEVLREYKISVEPLEAIAGPSTSRQNRLFKSSIQSAADISFSQVDPSFLDALPNYLKMELVAELKSDRTRQGADKILLTGIHKSPEKVNSPKKKRGRPKGSKNGTFKVSPKKKVRLSPMKIILNDPQEPPKSHQVVDSSSESEDEDLVLRVNARLEDILALVRDWVESTSEPTEVEISTMLDFLKRLLDVKKLDKLQAVLQTIKMITLRRMSEGWSAAFTAILSGIQPAVAKKFGCRLKI